MGLLGAIARLGTGSYTRTRRVVGTTTLGRYTEGAASTTTIKASVQPVSGPQNLKALPEGRHAEDMLVVYTVSPLLVTPIPDQITIDGEQWEVATVETWTLAGQTHYRAYVSRLAVP